MTKLMRALAALFLLLTGPLAAQQSHPAPQPVLAEPAAQVLKPALWKVADADTTVYLFGTIHALPKDLVWLEGPVATALEGSDDLVTEIPEPDPAKMMELVLRRAVMPKGQSLRTILSPQEYQGYEAAMRKVGIPAAAFDRFKPWYVALTLTTLPLLRDGYAVENGVEQQLTARARALGKPHRALETIEFQIAMFDDLPLDLQRQFLVEAIAGQADLRRQLDLLVAEWGQGHTTKLGELMREGSDDPRARAAIFTDRNRKWTDWINQRLTQPGSSFMAVGAGHLVGDDSVLDLLSKQGLQVSRLQ
jgi:uncharacterized protein